MEKSSMLEQAHFLLLNQEVHSAIKAYSIFISTNPNHFQALIARSIAYYLSGRFEDSINDAESAIISDRQRYEGFQRRGLALFAKSKIQAALIDLQEAASRAQGDAQTTIFSQIDRCKAELYNKQFSETPQKQVVKKVEVPLIVEKSTEKQSENDKIVYKWYQTDLKVGIQIQHLLQDPSKLKTTFTNKKLHVQFPLSATNEFELDIDLCEEVVADKCKATVGINQIEIVLEKQIKNKNWSKLEANEDLSTQCSVPVQVVKEAAYPSSSINKRDWSKINKEIDEDIQKNKEDYGMDPLNGLFQEIYKNGDEKTKQAMIKSMQTSGGTVLSTNWAEVSEKDYEGKDRPSPPKGQEKKKM